MREQEVPEEKKEHASNDADTCVEAHGCPEDALAACGRLVAHLSDLVSCRPRKTQVEHTKVAENDPDNGQYAVPSWANKMEVWGHSDKRKEQRDDGPGDVDRRIAADPARSGLRR